MQDERYPIGQVEIPLTVSKEQINEWIEDIKMLPQRVRSLVEHLNEQEIALTYRAGSWTVRQLVHHLADSHMNSFIRFKLALTEEKPTIKPYDENAWIDLPDSELPVEVSLTILGGVHLRWSVLMESLTDEQWQRVFIHPDSGEVRLDHCAALYAWHSNHHLAHIKQALKGAS